MRHTRQGALADWPAWAEPEKHRPSSTRKRSRAACQRGTAEDSLASGETNKLSKESLPPRDSGSFFYFFYVDGLAKTGRGKIDSVLSPLGELCLKRVLIFSE